MEEIENETDVIRLLVGTINQIKHVNLENQKELLLESRKATKLYEKILEQLSVQNNIMQKCNVIELRK